MLRVVAADSFLPSPSDGDLQAGFGSQDSGIWGRRHMGWHESTGTHSHKNFVHLTCCLAYICADAKHSVLVSLSIGIAIHHAHMDIRDANGMQRASLSPMSTSGILYLMSCAPHASLHICACQCIHMQYSSPRSSYGSLQGVTERSPVPFGGAWRTQFSCSP